jgi:uncharacterized protein (TIGR03083 family)
MTSAAVEGLRATHSDLVALLRSIDEVAWLQPSACAGWRVHDVVAHVTSNFQALVEPAVALAEPTEPMTAEQAMEALVAPRKEWTRQQLLDEYERYVDGAFATLAAMQAEPLASTPMALADLGSYPMHLLANAYCFDHYCHLRHDLVAPAGPLADTLPTADDARLRPGIEWMWAGLPTMCPAVSQVVDRPITIELTGVGGGRWALLPANSTAGPGATITVEQLDLGESRGAAAATSTAHDFVSWGTGRSAWRRACTLNGDTDYAARVLDAIDII